MALSDGNITLKLSELTPLWLKRNYLTGLTFIDAAKKEYPDYFYETHLQNAAAKLEKLCDISIVQQSIRNEEHDYRINDFQNWGYLQLYKVPVRKVNRIRAVYPLGKNLITYPNEWIEVNGESGQIFLVPTRGPLGQILIGQGGEFLPLIYSGISYLPNLWQVDYDCGMDPENFPRMIAEAIAKLAVVDILLIFSDIVRPIGVSSQSASIDGLSQSQSYQLPAFQARINQYMNDLYGPAGKNQQLAMTQGLLKQILDAYRPINLSSL